MVHCLLKTPEPPSQMPLLSLQESTQFSEYSKVSLKAEKLVPPIGWASRRKMGLGHRLLSRFSKIFCHRLTVSACVVFMTI